MPSGRLKSVSSMMKASTDCEGMVKFCVLTSPPPYWNVAALMTAMPPLWMPTLPHAAGNKLGRRFARRSRRSR